MISILLARAARKIDANPRLTANPAANVPGAHRVFVFFSTPGQSSPRPLSIFARNEFATLLGEHTEMTRELKVARSNACLISKKSGKALATSMDDFYRKAKTPGAGLDADDISHAKKCFEAMQAAIDGAEKVYMERFGFYECASDKDSPRYGCSLRRSEDFRSTYRRLFQQNVKAVMKNVKVGTAFKAPRVKST